jgi:hypothetical protein
MAWKDPAKYQAYLARLREKRKTPEAKAKHNAGRKKYLSKIKGTPKADARKQIQNNWKAKVDYKEKQRRYNLKQLCKKRGITVEEYDAMLTAQNGVCAICKKRKPWGRGGSDSLCIDHCHKTNKVRALLCFGCNTAIGLAEDNPFLLDAMAEYLRKHN